MVTHVLHYIRSLVVVEKPVPETHIEAMCPNCGHGHQIHEVKGEILKCTICGNQQHQDDALTREETAW